MLKYRETEGTSDGFNRSHAASYAYVCYQTAFFKTYYPLEFMTSLLTVFGDKEDKVVSYIEECKRMGIRILPPDINLSDEGFKIEGDYAIRFGLQSIKGLGKAVVEAILTHRPFSSLADIIERVPKRQLNKRSLSILALSGALDGLTEGQFTNRMEILQHLHYLRGDKDDLSNEIESFDYKTQLEHEKKLLGLYLSGHPLDGYGKPVNWNSIGDYENIETAGFVVTFKETVTKKGEPMCFILVETMEGNKWLTVFPEVYQGIKGQLKNGMVIKFKCYMKYNPQFNDRSIIVKKLEIPKRRNKHLLH